MLRHALVESYEEHSFRDTNDDIQDSMTRTRETRLPGRF